MRSFEVDPLAYDEFLEAAAWYADQGVENLAEQFVAEVERVLRVIKHHDDYGTAPIARVDSHAVVRRELTRRFPYMVVFVESDTVRKVIVIRRSDSDPERWRTRLPR